MVHGYFAVWHRIRRDYFSGAYCESNNQEKSEKGRIRRR